MKIVKLAIVLVWMVVGVVSAREVVPARSGRAYGLVSKGSEVVRPGPSEQYPGARTEFRSYFEPTVQIPFGSESSEFYVGSSVAADFYGVRHGRTLKDSVDDQVDQFRQRTEFAVFTRQGVGHYSKKSALDAKVTLGSTIFWRTFLGVKDYDGTQISPQDRIHAPWFLQLQEGWLRINFDQFVMGLKEHPHSLEAGVFPYIVGRGVSLGDWYQGGNYNFGFGRAGTQRYAPMYPPGILWSGNVRPWLSYEIYFSPLVSEEAIQSTVDNKSSLVVDWDKNSNARHIVAFKVKANFQFNEHNFGYLEPYFVYYNSPRQTVDRPADVPMRFGTLGVMWDQKVGNLEVNVEAAKQYGTQTVRPFVYRYAGFIDSTGKIDTSLGADGNFVHEELHKGRDIKLRGKMAMGDLRYKVENYPVYLTAAVGYFSGDDYPYNDALDKYIAGEISQSDWVAGTYSGSREYNGFLPIRDYHYQGLWATPLVMFSAGIVPRPLDMDLFNLTAYNDDDSATNIKFVGGGVQWFPLHDKSKLKTNANLFWYWEDTQLYRWDVSGARPVAITTGIPKVGGGYSTAYLDSLNTYNIQGWRTDQWASKFLGWEFNAIATYVVTDNCELSLRGGLFFPGSLYRDIVGMPNENTDVSTDSFTSDGTVTMGTPSAPGLGSEKAYGIYARLRYLF